MHTHNQHVLMKVRNDVKQFAHRCVKQQESHMNHITLGGIITSEVDWSVRRLFILAIRLSLTGAQETHSVGSGGSRSGGSRWFDGPRSGNYSACDAFAIPSPAALHKARVKRHAHMSLMHRYTKMLGNENELKITGRRVKDASVSRGARRVRDRKGIRRADASLQVRWGKIHKNKHDIQCLRKHVTGEHVQHMRQRIKYYSHWSLTSVL